MPDLVDDYIQRARTLLGTGHAPTPTTPTTTATPAAPSTWTGPASTAAATLTDTLTTNRGALHTAHTHTAGIISATAELPRTAHRTLDAIQTSWHTDKAALGPWGRTPAAHAALLRAGQQRIAETHALISEVATRYGAAAAAVRSAKLGLPDTPAGAPADGEDDPANPRRRDTKTSGDPKTSAPEGPRSPGAAGRPPANPRPSRSPFTAPAQPPMTATAAPLTSALPSAATALPQLAGSAPTAMSPMLQPLAQLSSLTQLASHLSPTDPSSDSAAGLADPDNDRGDHRKSLGEIAVEQARRALGLPYVWGGGGARGPSGGGFDCSGLTQFAIAQATDGQVILPRTTYDQIRVGRPVDLEHARPGDLVFSNFSRRGPEHVQLFAGHTAAGVPMVIEAQQTGVPVKFSQLSGHAVFRRVI